MTYQIEITLKPFARGFHLITDEIVSKLPDFTGIVHVFIQHTSASLTINENADPSVRVDFETHFNKLVSESDDHYTHTLEGKDDMTSHIKSSILGSSVSFPIKNGIPQLGTWQGVYLCEHRNRASGRKIFVTCFGGS
ncbi:MAG: secondary thiamine-phosphate synthase enzyme YjbQ [Flavobacteriaceae bacterium]